MKKDKHILIIRLSALGDVAMTIPAIYSLARQYPELKIDVLTRPFFAKLFINRPENVNMICADFKGEYKGFLGVLRLLRKLNSYKFDCVADLHNVLRSWEIDLFYLLKFKKVAMVDKLRKHRKSVLVDKVEQPNFVNRYTQVFKRLGYPITLKFNSLFEGDNPQTPIEIQHPAVGIAPFARYMNKTYPVDKMQDVVERLAKDGIHVYLFGGRGKEAEIMESWQNANPNCISFAGKYPISDELALMSKMDVMITMDSANQHMASLVGTTVLSIWGSTTPECGFLGYNQSKDNAMRLNLPCQPCSIAGTESCPLGHLNCMNQIATIDVEEKIKNLIQNNR